jgi:hypothetical protein
MLMNKRILNRLIFISFLLVFSVLVLAQGTQEQEAATTGSEEPVKTSPQASGDAEIGSETPAGDAASATGGIVKPIKEFKPTEQIEADSAVSFPIDI